MLAPSDMHRGYYDLKDADPSFKAKARQACVIVTSLPASKRDVKDIIAYAIQIGAVVRTSVDEGTYIEDVFLQFSFADYELIYADGAFPYTYEALMEGVMLRAALAHIEVVVPSAS